MVIGNLLAVERGNDVALLESCLGAGAIRCYVANEGALGRRQIERLGKIRGHFLNAYAQESAGNLSGLENLLHHRARHIDRHREADSLIASASIADDRGIDANQLAARVDQSSSGVPGIDRSIGLNEVLI